MCSVRDTECVGKECVMGTGWYWIGLLLGALSEDKFCVGVMNRRAGVGISSAERSLF